MEHQRFSQGSSLSNPSSMLLSEQLIKCWHLMWLTFISSIATRTKYRACTLTWSIVTYSASVFLRNSMLFLYNIELIKTLQCEVLRFQENINKTWVTENSLIHMRGSSLKNENALGDENDISRNMGSIQQHDQTPLFLNICSRMFKNKTDGLFLPLWQLRARE